MLAAFVVSACEKKPEATVRRNPGEDPVKRLLSARPLELATLEPRFGEFDSVQSKVDAFLVAPAGTELRLTEHEFGLFMTGGPDDVDLRESGVWGIVLDDEGKSRLCLETALSLKSGGMQGKYLNAKFYVSLEEGPEGMNLDVPTIIVGEKYVDSYDIILITDIPAVRSYLWDSPRLQGLMRCSKQFKIDGMNLVFRK